MQWKYDGRTDAEMEMECGLQQIKMRHASRDASRLDSAAVAAAGDHNHRQQWARYTYGEDGVSEHRAFISPIWRTSVA